MTEASRTTKEAYKFLINIDGESWGSDALAHPVDELQRESHDAEEVQNELPIDSIKGFEDIHFDGASRLEILSMIVVEKFLG